jgi:hypothetical protein
VRCSCLKVAHSRELKSSFKNKIQEWSLGREERAQKLNLRSVFRFLWVGNGLMGRWGFIYSTHLKKSRWGIFHRIGMVNLTRIRWKLSGSRPGAGQVRWRPLESDWSLWNLVSDQTCLIHRTSLVGLTGVWSIASGIRWIHRTSLVKHGKKEFWEENTSTFSQTFSMRHSW